ncbi:acetyl-coenzyme A synthetase, cytoplasmic-like [Oppia nitens]|uniref:acetyl-coenzyme A synthetase, cytoplasmic-like n=1 Tax=Oppia nitens TaxID=1686743 RepID=UPI0023DB425E|nr:acetyl-coenzyme A synthetase, cytoplasmic-like [Oppia nitens]
MDFVADNDNNNGDNNNNLLGETFTASDKFLERAHITRMDYYHRIYQLSVQNPDAFWLNIAEQFYWHNGIQRNNNNTRAAAAGDGADGKLFDYNFDVTKGPINIRFMSGSKTNACYNLVDRIIDKGLGDRIAYIWIGNDLNERKTITYSELKRNVCKFANVLKIQGIRPGYRVAIYLPVSLELVTAMLACSRIGAVHTVVFAGFSSQSLADRIIDANCRLLVTADGTVRGNKLIKLKDISDESLVLCKHRNHKLVSCIVVKHLPVPNSCQQNRWSKYEPKFDETIDHYWDELIEAASDECQPVWLDAEDPLFILYTSGSTGKPKGVVHTIAGYMLTTALVFKYAFNYRDGDTFFCTADLGWITGHTANVYGSLANGATAVLFDGIPTHPNAGRLWQIIDENGVNSFYTAPTAVRTLMKFGDDYVNRWTMAKLKLIALVGEPINREAWLWLYNVVGRGRCPIVDTYFQTETGAPMIFPIPGCIPMKPGSATLPFFGIVPVILSEDGQELSGPNSGYLAFKNAWPSIARTIDGNHERFESTYFRKFPNYYFTGDGAVRDQNGYLWVTGRTDDMLNVSGHLLSTAEVESAILDNKRIAEVAAVSMSHPIKGEAICCFVVLKAQQIYDLQLEIDLKQRVRDKIGAIATPECLFSVRALPKTRSGKIMRRILAKIARNDVRELGDLSTISDESVIDELITVRRVVGDGDSGQQ